MMIVAKNQAGQDDQLLVVAQVVGAARMDNNTCTVQTADGSTVAFAGTVESVVEILSDAEREELRDKFAGQALQGMLANPGGPLQQSTASGWGLVNTTPQLVAESCYDFADAMLAARKKGQQ